MRSGLGSTGREVTLAEGPDGEDAPAGHASPPTRDSALPARFGKNVFMNYAAQGLTALSAVVLTPILLHHLGKSTYGLWVVASGAVAYLELFELGFGGATTKLIAEDASVRPEAALRTLNTTFFVLVPLGIMALLVGVGLSFAMPHLVHVTTTQRAEVVVVTLLLTLGLAASIPGDTFGGALVGHQRYDLLAAANASMTLATAVASIAVVEGGRGVVMLAFVTTMVSVLFHVVRFGMVRKILPGTRISPRLVDKGQRRHAVRLSGWFLLQGLLAAVYSTADVMIVGFVLGLKDAAIYAVGSKLSSAAIYGLDAMAQVFFPYASWAARNKDRQALAEISIDGTRVTLAAGLGASLLLIVLAAPGIHAWVGPGYGVSVQVLVVLAAATALASPVRAIGNVLIGAGSLPTVCAIRSVEVTVNLSLSIVLGLVMGPVGVAVGTLAGILLVRLPGYMVAGCRAAGLRVSTLARRAILPNVVPAAGCAGVLLCLRLVPLRSIPWLFLEAAVGGGTYLVLFFVAAATPDEKRRGRALVTRPLPARWRPHDPASVVDATTKGR